MVTVPASDAYVGPLIESTPGGDVIIVKPGGAIVTTGTGQICGAVESISVSVSSATAGVSSAILDQIAALSVPITVRSVKLMPAGTCAGNATSNFTLSVRNIGSGATGSTDVATLSLTTSNALAANVPKAFTLATTAASLVVTATEAVAYYITLVSSGIDFPKGKITVDYVVNVS